MPRIDSQSPRAGQALRRKSLQATQSLPGQTLSQDLKFRAPVSPGDAITATVTVTELVPEKHYVSLDCRCTNQNGVEVIRGTATVQAPVEKVSRRATVLPEVRLLRHERLRNLLVSATGTPLPTAIAHPCDEVSLLAAAEAAQTRFGAKNKTPLFMKHATAPVRLAHPRTY